MMDDYADCDATELAARVASGQVSAAELVEQAIAAIERVNPRLNAVVHRMYDEARALAQQPLPSGPFRGVPMVVKDFDGYVRGVPFTGSCRLLEGFVPDHDSEAIARLRRAGLIFVAKTNCPELAMFGTTEPAWRGATRNPYDPERSTGGSSGGSAALVAARAVAIGHGGDGGGSLRIPGSHCGLVALKPTRGRVPLGPDDGEMWGGYVQWGVLTRSVRDTAALLDVLGGPMPGDPYAAPPLPGPLAAEVGRDPGKLRIGFHAGSLFAREIDPQRVAAVTEVAGLLQKLGHHVEPAQPEFDAHELTQAYFVQIASGIAAEVVEYGRLCAREPRAELFEPETWFVQQVGQTIGAIDLIEARAAVQRAGRATAAFHARYDLFLCATTAYPQSRIGELALKPTHRIGLAALRKAPVPAALRRALYTLGPTILERTPNTQLFNQTGQPAISLPLAQAQDGMPIGVQLAAAMGREDLLICIAAQLESERPWRARRPRITA